MLSRKSNGKYIVKLNGDEVLKFRQSEADFILDGLCESIEKVLTMTDSVNTAEPDFVTFMDWVMFNDREEFADRLRNILREFEFAKRELARRNDVFHAEVADTKRTLRDFGYRSLGSDNTYFEKTVEETPEKTVREEVHGNGKEITVQCVRTIWWKDTEHGKESIRSTARQLPVSKWMQTAYQNSVKERKA